MSNLRTLGLLFGYLLLGASMNAQSNKLSASEAKTHVGERATVCGAVAGGRYASSSKGKPTFLDVDKPYPKETLTILIWGENRAKFETPEDKYRGKNICVTGKITEYRGTPEIVVTDPRDIEVQK